MRLAQMLPSPGPCRLRPGRCPFASTCRLPQAATDWTVRRALQRQARQGNWIGDTLAERFEAWWISCSKAGCEREAFWDYLGRMGCILTLPPSENRWTL